MCYLRGVIMLRMGRAKDAQESLMEALAIDYKNFDAFETLIGGDMMTIDEGDTNFWSWLYHLLMHLSSRVGIRSGPSIPSRRSICRRVCAFNIYRAIKEGE